MSPPTEFQLVHVSTRLTASSEAPPEPRPLEGFAEFDPIADAHLYARIDSHAREVSERALKGLGLGGGGGGGGGVGAKGFGSMRELIYALVFSRGLHHNEFEVVRCVLDSNRFWTQSSNTKVEFSTNTFEMSLRCFSVWIGQSSASSPISTLKISAFLQFCKALWRSKSWTSLRKIPIHNSTRSILTFSNCVRVLISVWVRYMLFEYMPQTT